MIAVTHEKMRAWDDAAEQFQLASGVITEMINNQQYGQMAFLLKDEVESRRAQLAAARIALGDWNELLSQPADQLPALLEMRAISFTQQSIFVEAAQAASKLVELKEADEGQLYNAACVFCICASAIPANQTDELSVDQEKAREKYLSDALATLKLAIQAGWDDFAHIQEDPDLKILRDRPEFSKLIPTPEQTDAP